MIGREPVHVPVLQVRVLPTFGVPVIFGLLVFLGAVAGGGFWVKVAVTVLAAVRVWVGGGFWVKVAVAVLSESTETWQAPVPEQPAPDQPAKVESADAFAVRVTAVPSS